MNIISRIFKDKYKRDPNCILSVSDKNIQALLLDLGYSSNTNKTGVIFANVIDQIFFGFGSTIQNGLINEAKKQNLPSNFKFPYYSLVEKSILDFLGEVAGNKILKEINAEFSRQTKIEGTTEEILNELSKKEVLNQIQKFEGHEHIMYLWKDVDLRDKVLTHFLEVSKGPKAAISQEKINISNVETITYSELFVDKTQIGEKSFATIANLHKTNKTQNPTNIVGWDNTEWLSQGLQKEFLGVEKSAQKYIEEHCISAICAYDLKKIPNEDILKNFLEPHSIVMLDDPFVIYQRGN